MPAISRSDKPKREESGIMANCHYCKNELEMGEFLKTESGSASADICMNEFCQVHKIVNLYFKSWFLTPNAIVQRLENSRLTWSWSGNFFVRVTPIDHHEVRHILEKLCHENGSILFESEIDFVESLPVN